MAKFNIPVLLGTRRKDNLSNRVAQYIQAQLTTLDFVESPLLDLGAYDFPILEERYADTEDMFPALRKFSDLLKAADGLIIVSPEYKNSLPGGLKNALDYLPPGHFKHKAIGICSVSSGPFGGLNCLAQLRLICISMGGIVIPERFPISFVQETFAEGGVPQDAKKMQERFGLFWKDMIWHTEALVDRRKR